MSKTRALTTREDGSLVSERELSEAAWSTAIPTAVVVFAGAAHIPFWFFYAVNRGLAPFLRGVLPGPMARGVGLAIILSTPLLGAWIVTMALRGRVRAAATKSAEAGRAAAAGVCLASVGMGAMIVLADQLLVRPNLWNLGLWGIGGAFGLGLVGAGVFREAAKASSEEATPELYPAVLTAGLAAPLECIAMSAVLLLMSWFPILSPVYWGALFGFTYYSAWLAWTLTLALSVVPLAASAAAGVRWLFPSADSRSLAVGAALPSAIALTVMLFRAPWGSAFQGVGLFALLGAVGLHLGAGWLGAETRWQGLLPAGGRDEVAGGSAPELAE